MRTVRLRLWIAEQLATVARWFLPRGYSAVVLHSLPDDPLVDGIVIWFNMWLREPITDRERTIIRHTFHPLAFPADMIRAIDDWKRWGGNGRKEHVK